MGWNAKYAILILLSTVIDYIAALGMDQCENPRIRKQLLWASIASNLGILCIFKYYNFFAASAAQALQAIGVHASTPTLKVLLPAGISFYTFQTLSYTIDVYRREMRATRNFFDFALFVAFFPQLVAGPIVRAKDFLPQLDRDPVYEPARIKSGLLLIFTGLFKKIVIADALGELLVDPAFREVHRASGLALLLALFAFSLQVYADFSGYSDVARGASRMLGYELTLNFNLPFRAKSMREIWQRWHMTLSTFFRDYVYVPLGGGRRGKWSTARNVMAVMTLSGLWHGAAWTFVVWGILNGLFLVAEIVLSRGPKASSSPVVDVMRTAWTFCLFSLTMAIFRADSLHDSIVLLRRIATWAADEAGAVRIRERGLWILLLALVLHYFPRRWYWTSQRWVLERSPFAQGALAACSLGFFAVATTAGQPFIYFQF
jgi:D-alanyl-lipoteichoic acid acyltransferase DltB (MBOAT superfamily)